MGDELNGAEEKTRTPASGGSGEGPMGPTCVRILTTYDKMGHPQWRERTVLVPGWLEAARQARGKPSPYSYADALRWGWRIFRASKRFDAVVTGNERPALAFAALQALLRRKRIPHILVGSFWFLPPGLVKSILKRLRLRLVSRGVNRIVAYSQRQAQLLKKTFGVPARKLAVLHYHTTLWRDEYPVDEGDYIFAGGDTNRDYRMLIEAVGGLPYRVVIAVLRTDHFAGITIPPNVEILTASREQFFTLMARSGVVVVPMLGGLVHSGGHQTYLNAMALGKPVVVADDCGADEYVVNGVTGIVVTPGDSAGLRQALRTLMDDRTLARQLAQNGKLLAQDHSPEKWFERVFTLAEECRRETYNG